MAAPFTARLHGEHCCLFLFAKFNSGPVLFIPGLEVRFRKASSLHGIVKPPIGWQNPNSSSDLLSKSTKEGCFSLHFQNLLGIKKNRWQTESHIENFLEKREAIRERCRVHPSFQELLNRVEEEFSYHHQQGGLTIPCNQQGGLTIPCKKGAFIDLTLNYNKIKMISYSTRVEQGGLTIPCKDDAFDLTSRLQHS
ncbi:hypothetical protein SDJN03_02329, partial [Cucurbita argyrosperma subsp. sororia]